MSVNKVIVLFCNKTTILMKFERKLGMRYIYRGNTTLLAQRQNTMKCSKIFTKNDKESNITHC